ncbi:hypothetical protein DM02DRAFT_544150, partial [Periconia macrospinosa]
QIVLSDFRIAVELDKNRKCAGMSRTKLYIAPEVFSSAEYDEKVNLWSAGTTMLQLCHELPVFSPNEWPEILAAHAKDLKEDFYRNQRYNVS